MAGVILMKITAFQGIKPRTSPRLLENSEAQIADNTNLASGELRPLALPRSTYVTTKVGPLLSIYKADQLTPTSDLWFTWPYDVDVCRSPLPGEVKYIYSGDGEPRITTAALAVSGPGVDNYPSAARSLGVPKPLSAPVVVATGGVLADINRYYLYSFYDDWNQESAYSPLSALILGKPDGTWAVSGMDEAPANSGGISNVTYSGTTVTITTTKHFNRAGEQVVINGVTTVTNVNGTWTLTATTPTTLVFTVATAPTGTYNNAIDTSDTWARKAPWGVCTKRLYRTSGTKAQFQLVATDITGTTFNDNIGDSGIPGDEAISASWELPPVDLKGVFTLPSGAIGGFSGNEFCLSEPFQPHAWPPEYRMRSEYPIVAAGLFTSGVVLGTIGEPVVVIGHEPGQMMAQPVKAAYPCLSKRSMVSMGDRVGYATAHGFATVGDNGVELMTVGSYTRDEWAKLDPSTMIGEAVRGRLYLMTNGAGPKMLIFDYLDGTGLTTSGIDATEIFADSLAGKLYVSDAGNMDVREFDPVDGVFSTLDWMSKEFVVPEPINIGAARVNYTSRWEQATYDSLLADYNAAVAANGALLATADGSFNADEFNVREIAGSSLGVVRKPDLEGPGVTFTLYVDGVVVFSQEVKNNKGFALPSGYRADTFAIRVQGQSVVKSIDFAQTMLGLKGA